MPLVQAVRRSQFKGSAAFWEENYAAGLDSGPGSYGKFATFKANILNEFVAEHAVDRVVEFGCGDGNQLSLAEYPEYIGLDVARGAIARCSEKFCSDSRKSFFLYEPGYMMDNLGLMRSDLGLSLDVTYHLIEDAIFSQYIQDLFASSSRFVIIYSSDTEDLNDAMRAGHVRHRAVSAWVNSNVEGWSLTQRIPNKFPFHGDVETGSFADFMIFERDKDRA